MKTSSPTAAAAATRAPPTPTLQTSGLSRAMPALMVTQHEETLERTQARRASPARKDTTGAVATTSACNARPDRRRAKVAQPLLTAANFVTPARTRKAGLAAAWYALPVNILPMETRNRAWPAPEANTSPLPRAMPARGTTNWPTAHFALWAQSSTPLTPHAPSAREGGFKTTPQPRPSLVLKILN